MSAQLSTHDLALVDAIAERVLELLNERSSPSSRPRLVDAGELAEFLGVSRDTVYRRADDLVAGGAAWRLGEQGRSEHGGSRLRFDRDKALAIWTGRHSDERSQTPEEPVMADEPAIACNGTSGSGADLLSIRGPGRRGGRRGR